ncbi:hypothetical protein [Sphingomonas sp.]|uniref:hypothetical protein n=1 Tax=Sphingomonas sp. TaxID=28214 RepID=UPI002FC6730D
MRSNGVIVILGALVVLMVGALMFMVGRSGTQERTDTIAARPAPAQTQSPAVPDTTAAATPAAAQPRTAGEESAAGPIPSAFLGEWNASLEDCGTGLDLSRMRVEPQRVLFHESEAEAKLVTIDGPRSITIEGPFQGEGETWNGRLRMDLSASGDALTIGDLTRRRCPS